MPVDSIMSTVRYREIKPGYRVGDDGSVWSQIYPGGVDKRRLGEWRRLKPTPQRRGHLAIWLGRDDQRFVHRLVLQAFVGPCPEGMECRHLDGNSANNRLENLAWGTCSENSADMVKHGRAGRGRRDGRPVGSGHKLNPGAVPAIRAALTGQRGKERAAAIARLAEEHGVTASYIRLIASGGRCEKVA
jgi:hypothetical protein